MFVSLLCWLCHGCVLLCHDCAACAGNALCALLYFLCHGFIICMLVVMAALAVLAVLVLLVVLAVLAVLVVPAQHSGRSIVSPQTECTGSTQEH